MYQQSNLGKTNNTTTSRNDEGDQNSAPPQSVKIGDLQNKIYRMPLPDLKAWFGHLRKASESGKPIMIKYVGKYYDETCQYK